MADGPETSSADDYCAVQTNPTRLINLVLSMTEPKVCVPTLVKERSHLQFGLFWGMLCKGDSVMFQPRVRCKMAMSEQQCQS